MAKRLDEAALRDRIDAYFSACDETAERVVLKSGGVSFRQTPYTLAGLSEYLHVPQQRMRELAKRSDAAKRAPGGEARLYADALRRIERYTVERALLGEVQYSVAAMLLRDLGSGEHLPPEQGDGRVVIVMEDREGWSE